MSNKIITIYDNKSLFELDWRLEEPILIYDSNPELLEIAILMKPYKVITGNDKRIGFSVSFTPQGMEQAEQYIFLTPRKKALGLWLPEKHDGSQRINTRTICPEASPQPYTITHAVTGEEAIIHTLYEILQGREPCADTINQQIPKSEKEGIDAVIRTFLNKTSRR